MNNSIPIFDSLTHPTIDSNWIMPRYQGVAHLETLQKQMGKANVKWAFVVGMAGVGSYSQEEYIKLFANEKNKNLFPIAFYIPKEKEINNIRLELKKIKEIGYKGIKLHPRFSNFSIDETLADVIKIANELGLVCLLCTYCYGSNSANRSTPESLMKMLAKIDDAKVVLIHGGAVRLLEYMEVARAYNNVLLDLSLTLCKYEGSSLDMDISFLFKQFDRRICIGSDFPEISLEKVRERFEYFSQGISLEKKQNIAYKNIVNFCNIDL